MGLFSEIKEDFDNVYRNDPAIRSKFEFIFNYPGVWSIAWYRLAHRLHRANWKLAARLIMGISQFFSNIDIHPAARIGRGIMIDHATGIVIGETTVIGDRVKLYQGVTLGALSFRRNPDGSLVKGGRRHPTVEDDVTIYSGATILGRVCIGRGSIIGGNVWLTRSLPPRSKITQAKTSQEMYAGGSGI